MPGEFEFLQNVKKRYGLSHIGDDCAVIPKDALTDTVITVDMMVEDIDFRLNWAIPDFLGHKSLAVSLTDVAAMGGKPVWAMLSLGIPEKLWNTSFIDKFYEGWHQLAQIFNVELIGGDISKVPEKLVIDSIVGGETLKNKAVYRSGASAGDLIFVTGELGGASAGLKLLEDGITYQNDLSEHVKHIINKQLRPLYNSPLRQFSEIVRTASAAIDISDGMLSDLEHICRQSNVGAIIHSEKIPINKSLRFTDFSTSEQLDFALTGGEDFELIVTADSSLRTNFIEAGFIEIGTITDNATHIELLGQTTINKSHSTGFAHFK